MNKEWVNAKERLFRGYKTAPRNDRSPGGRRLPRATTVALAITKRRNFHNNKKGIHNDKEGKIL